MGRCISCGARRLKCDGQSPCSRCRDTGAECSDTWTLSNSIYQLFPAADRFNTQLTLSLRSRPEATGGFGRVYKVLASQGALVAVKILFQNTWLPERALELSVREAWTWSRLDHPNILPLLGIADYQLICQGALSQLCLISPWVEHGNVMSYIAQNPSVSKWQFLHDVALAVQYLHQLEPSPVIHGDISGRNILIDMQEGRASAKLTDFGLANIVESLDQDALSTTTNLHQGNPRWMAFERLFPQKYQITGMRESKSTYSDVFEMMRTFYEICTGQAPFHGLRDFEVLAALSEEKNPIRPDPQPTEINDDMWALMVLAWDASREKRPSISRVLQVVEGQMQIAEGGIQPAESEMQAPAGEVQNADGATSGKERPRGRSMDFIRFRELFSTEKGRALLSKAAGKIQHVSLSSDASGPLPEETLHHLLTLCPPSYWVSLRLRDVYVDGFIHSTLWGSMHRIRGDFQRLRAPHLRHLWLENTRKYAAHSDITSDALLRFAPNLEDLRLDGWVLDNDIEYTVDDITTLRGYRDFPLPELQHFQLRGRPAAFREPWKGWVIAAVMVASPKLQSLIVDYSNFIHKRPEPPRDPPIWFTLPSKELPPPPLGALTRMWLHRVQASDCKYLFSACKETAEKLVYVGLSEIYDATLSPTQKGRLPDPCLEFCQELFCFSAEGLKMLTLAYPIYSDSRAVTSGLFTLLGWLLFLEVLDIAPVIYWQDVYEKPELHGSNRFLTLLRAPAGEPLAKAVSTWTGRPFVKVSQPIEELLKSSLPGVPILKECWPDVQNRKGIESDWWFAECAEVRPEQ